METVEDLLKVKGKILAVEEHDTFTKGILFVKEIGKHIDFLVDNKNKKMLDTFKEHGEKGHNIRIRGYITNLFNECPILVNNIDYLD